MLHHHQKASEQVKHAAARFLGLESNRTSLITVTNAAISDDGKYATIFITVFPEAEEKSALDFVKRKRSEFKAFLKEETRLRTIPFVDFTIDSGEKNRQRIEEISRDE